jgi:hypothetical protein
MFTNVLQDLVGRTDGPLTLRLLIQPTVAALLAIRAARCDAAQGNRPILWSILVSQDGVRRDLARQAWGDIGKLFTMACILDVIYQLLVFKWVYPFQTLTVACVVSIIPYVLIRGTATRLIKRFTRNTRRSESPI